MNIATRPKYEIKCYNGALFSGGHTWLFILIWLDVEFAQYIFLKDNNSVQYSSLYVSIKISNGGEWVVTRLVDWRRGDFQIYAGPTGTSFGHF